LLIIEPLKIVDIILAIIVPKANLNFVTWVIRELTIIAVQRMGHSRAEKRFIRSIKKVTKCRSRENKGLSQPAGFPICPGPN